MQSIAWDNDMGRGGPATTATGELADDGALDTLVALSLFTNAPATAEEMEAAGRERQSGWWADADSVRQPGTPVMGSKLWLLLPGKLTREVIVRVERYAAESLAWLLVERIAAEVTVTARREGASLVVIEVVIRRPSKLLPVYRKLWQVPFG